MTITVALHHRTTYHYDRQVALSPHIFRLRPAPHCRTPVRSYSFKVSPSEHFINWQQDPFGNFLARLVFPKKTKILAFDVELVLDLVAINPFDFFVEESAKDFPFQYSEEDKKALAPYLAKETLGPMLSAWLKTLPDEKIETIPFLFKVNQLLAEKINYTIRLETGVQTVEYTLEKCRGSCRDSAWVLVQALRHLGIAARFVSGYLVQLKSDRPSLDGPSGPQEDFTDLHAWAEAYIPGAGWVGMDPTSGLFASEGHIPLACAPHYSSAAPVVGASDKAEVEFDFSNSVTRIHEDPRVTRPYSSEQWQSIDQFGHYVEDILQSEDVRLTMGGEPTFIAIDDYESGQWNHDALGAHKRDRAEVLFQRLCQQYAPQGLRHYGQGKWYPGEPLPRWALKCIWRKDGQPIWKNTALYADYSATYEVGLDEAGSFITALANTLGLSRQCILSAFEDTAYQLWQEGNLPPDFKPEEKDLKRQGERAQLLALLDQGLGIARGFVLPIHWHAHRGCWQSSQWRFKRGLLFLAPGDSPMGLRLPLDRVGWDSPGARVDADISPDPFAEYPPLAVTLAEARDRLNIALDSQEAANGYLLTALCVEVREQKLFVFMPPLATLEAYLLLVEAVEQTAAQLELPVILEGYGPPDDPRIQSLAVTPDPGVIEVNIHPARDWSELQQTIFSLYEHARHSRLDTVKYMVDGRQIGTGGGNHITIGGASASDSPVLRNPQVLRSLLTYWQHHPGLSYVFSTAFIGPTSQAPRVDESRQEFLYELETAFRELDTAEYTPPWLTDRLLRHLLVDLTGNTHRAEFCIDKLYSPDSSSGRLGLLEFRGFEMPPHPQMALAQMLLIRTFVARFWRKPYQRDLVRWGTSLHDKFLLPHFAWRDLEEVCQDLSESGFAFQADWLKPFWEFRFPVLGRVNYGDIQIELRAAIEPWHVLGEEMGRAGTARYVDSSIERVQIRLQGLTDNRYIVSCNGARAVLSPTGVQGEYVAGIRFRAWAPPSCLHPTIGVQSPLTIDLVDTWTGKAVGGCTYHVSHPGGRSFDTFPVNELEAEGRVLARFQGDGHSPGPIAPVLKPSEPAAPSVLKQAAMSGVSLGYFEPRRAQKTESIFVPDAKIELDFPYTLDLLRQSRR